MGNINKEGVQDNVVYGYLSPTWSMSTDKKLPEAGGAPQLIRPGPVLISDFAGALLSQMVDLNPDQAWKNRQWRDAPSFQIKNFHEATDSSSFCELQRLDHGCYSGRTLV